MWHNDEVTCRYVAAAKYLSDEMKGSSKPLGGRSKIPPVIHPFFIIKTGQLP